MLNKNQRYIVAEHMGWYGLAMYLLGIVFMTLPPLGTLGYIALVLIWILVHPYVIRFFVNRTDKQLGELNEADQAPQFSEATK